VVPEIEPKELRPMKNLFTRLWKDESAATAIEYGLIAALISVAIIVAVTALGGTLQNTFNAVNAAMSP
jgi:pilus assembly protein Flp/PilA